jgi:hypothetical protein
VTVDGLAQALGVEPAEAERLLTELTVHERTRIDVGDDAEVRYSATPGSRAVDPLLEEGSPHEGEAGDERQEGRVR